MEGAFSSKNAAMPFVWIESQSYSHIRYIYRQGVKKFSIIKPQAPKVQPVFQSLYKGAIVFEEQLSLQFLLVKLKPTLQFYLFIEGV